jgi:predicted dehydrogenase
MKKLKVGVIGCGVMGSFHLKQYKNIPDVEIVGVSDQDETKKPEGVPFYKNYKELLLKIDAVSIVTPTFTHFQVAMDAINSGVNVMIEKPIALNKDEAKKIIEAAKNKKAMISVGHIERFNPAFTALTKELGKNRPQLIDIKRMSPLPERISDVSCIIDMMVHDIDLALKLAGSEVKFINATGKKVKTNRIDHAQAIIVFKNGTVANIEASRVHNEKTRSIIAANNEYVIEADLLAKKAVKRQGSAVTELPVDALDSLNVELRNFVSSVISKKIPTVTGMDGMLALDLANRIEEMCVAI